MNIPIENLQKKSLWKEVGQQTYKIRWWGLKIWTLGIIKIRECNTFKDFAVIAENATHLKIWRKNI